jgi:protein transport protein SEC24
MGVRSVLQHLYPRLLALHDLDDQVALPDPTTGQIRLPSIMRNSHIYMQAHGIYLMGQSKFRAKCRSSWFLTSQKKTLDNEETMVIWIGVNASPQLLSDLFGVDEIFKIDPHLVSSIQIILCERNLCVS